MNGTRFDCHACNNDICLIKKHINEESVQPYLSKKNTFRCIEGQQFILEGAPVNGLYFIYSGSVKVYKQISDRDTQIIRFISNGEIVGHRGFGTNYVYGISASALTDSVLCHFHTDVLIEMLHKAPSLMFDFMVFYADQLQKSETNAKRFRKMSVREKVINGLLFIRQKFGETDGMISITLSRKDIADFAGTTQEQVIRIISALKKEDLIISKGKKIGIPNLQKIESEVSESGYFLEG